MISIEQERALIACARNAAANAYCPASSFRVGAAVLSSSGTVHPGCNVENASFGLTICAERNAVTRAVCEGARDLIAVAVWTDLEEPAAPCGACRQVLAEFGPEMTIFLTGRGDAVVRTTILELLPKPFTFAVLRQAADSND